MTAALPPIDSLRTRASRGMVFLTVQSAATRVILLASNWVLGFLLNADMFGVSGYVTIISSIAWAFVGFGLGDVLTQRGAGMRFWEATTTHAALIIGAAAAVGLIVLSPFLAWLFKDARLYGPIAVIALALPIAAISTASGARLGARMDFSFLVTWNLVELVLTQAIIIVAAFAGAGVYVFAIPMPIVFALRAIAYAMRAPPSVGRVQRGDRRGALLKRGAQVALAKLANNFVLQGAYIVLGVLANSVVMGYYFFAYRLAAVPMRVLAESLGTVLFPAMARLKGDKERQVASAVKSATLLSWVVSPFCYFQVVISEPVLRWFFNDKWLPSVIIIQLLSVGLAMESIKAVTGAYLNAAGRFNVALRYSVITGVGFFIACIAGALLGQGVGVALSSAIFSTIIHPGAFSLLVDTSGRRLSNAIRIFIAPAAVSLAAFGAAWWLARLPMAPQGPVMNLLFISLVGWTFFIALTALAAPAIIKEMTGLVRGVLKRGSAKEARAS